MRRIYPTEDGATIRQVVLEGLSNRPKHGKQTLVGLALLSSLSLLVEITSLKVATKVILLFGHFLMLD